MYKYQHLNQVNALNIKHQFQSDAQLNRSNKPGPGYVIYVTPVKCMTIWFANQILVSRENSAAIFTVKHTWAWACVCVCANVRSLWKIYDRSVCSLIHFKFSTLAASNNMLQVLHVIFFSVSYAYCVNPRHKHNNFVVFFLPDSK